LVIFENCVFFKPVKVLNQSLVSTDRMAQLHHGYITSALKIIIYDHSNCFG